MMEVYIEMGRVLEAHNNRFYLREKNRKQAPKVASAQREYHAMGMFEDCGSFYETCYTEAKAEASAALEAKIKGEKHFKKLKLTFAETYPGFVAELEKRLEDQAKKHTREINAAIAAEQEQQRQRELERLKHTDPWKYRMKMARKEKKTTTEQ
jgi:hypothetical protein